MATRLPDPQPAETLASRPGLIGSRPTTDTATGLAERQSKPNDVNYTDRLLVMRKLFGAGTPRGFADLVAALCHPFSGLWKVLQTHRTMLAYHPRKTDGISPIALPA